MGKFWGVYIFTYIKQIHLSCPHLPQSDPCLGYSFFSYCSQPKSRHTRGQEQYSWRPNRVLQKDIILSLLEARNKWEADINIQKCSKERNTVGGK